MGLIARAGVGVRVAVFEEGAALGGMGVDVPAGVFAAEDRGDVVAEEFGEDGGGEARGGIVKVESAAEASGAIAAGGDGSDVVADDDDGDAECGVDGSDEFGEAVLPGDVDADGGFVEQEDAGLAGDGAGDHGALDLPAGEPPDGSVGEVGGPHEGERIVDGAGELARGGAEGVEREQQRHRDHLSDREGETELGFDFLWDIADEPAASGVAWEEAGDADVAIGAVEEPEGEFEKRGFAAAVGPEHAESLTGADVEGDVLERGIGGAGVPEGDVAVGDGGLLGGHAGEYARSSGLGRELLGEFVEVGVHHGEPVAGAERVEAAEADAGGFGDSFGGGGVVLGLDEDGWDIFPADGVDDTGEFAGRGFGAFDALDDFGDAQAVALGGPAEGGVVGDDGSSGEGSESVAVVSVEGTDASEEFIGPGVEFGAGLGCECGAGLE